MLFNPYNQNNNVNQTNAPVNPYVAPNNFPQVTPTMPGMLPATGMLPAPGMPTMPGMIPAQGMPGMGSNSSFINPFGNLPNTANLGSTGAKITSPQQACSLIIRKIVMIETKPQREQTTRLMIPRVDNVTLNVMNNFKDSSPNMRLNGNIIGDMQVQGAKFFEISPQPSQMVGIVNGWQNIRLKFTITVDVYFSGLLSCTEYVTGYTDYSGANFSTKHLDPEMVFVIDSVTTSAGRHNSSAIGGVSHSIINSDLVIAKNSIQGFGQPQHMVTTRPVDVFTELMVYGQRQGAEIASGMAGMEGMSATMRPTYMNLNTSVGHTPVFSSIMNNVPNNYAARILDAHGKMVQIANEGTDIYGAARSEVMENTFSSSKFVHMLDEKSGSFDDYIGNTFKLKRLYAIDPVLANSSDDRIVIIRPDEFMRELQRTATGETISIPAGASCDALNGTGEIVANASAILHSANAHFRKAGASYVSCILTNHGGVPESRITSLLGIDDGLLYMRVNAACEFIMSETVRGITRDSMSYFIQIIMDVHNDVYIKIQIGMNPPHEFVAPCYALGITSPVISVNQSSLDNLVNSVREINDTIYGTTMTLGESPFNANTASY